MSTIITKRQFPGYHKYELDLAGRPLTLEVGKLAELANAAVMVGYGDTRVLCCVTAAPRPRDGIDFFPLSVDFEEKMYSVGRIPGSFNRREGRPGEKGILTSRVIDRPIRPLFPKDMRNDVSVVCTVMSVDPDCSPEIAAMASTTIKRASPTIPYSQVRSFKIFTFLTITGTINESTIPITTISNCLTALPKLSLLKIRNPILKSIHILLTISIFPFL